MSYPQPSYELTDHPKDLRARKGGKLRNVVEQITKHETRTSNTSGGESGDDTGDQSTGCQSHNVNHSVGSQSGQDTNRDTSGGKVTKSTQSVRRDELSTLADESRVGLGLGGKSIESNEF